MGLFRRATRPLAWSGILACVACGPPPRFEDLGIPRTTRGVQAGLMFEDRLFVTTFETEGQARLTVVDLATGRQQEHPLAGSKGSWALATDARNHAVYLAGSKAASVWRYDVPAGRLESLDAFKPLLTDEHHVFSLALDGQGRLFAGTYPGGLLLRYDAQTRTAKSLGAPVAGRQYVRSLAVGPSGTVYAAAGTPPVLAAVDPETGQSRMLLEGTIDDGTFPVFGREGDRPFVSIGTRRVFLDAYERGPFAPPPVDPGVGVDGSYSVTWRDKRVDGRLDLADRENGMFVMGLSTGPDGHVYGATYFNATVFRIEDTGRSVALGRVAGADGEFRVAAPLDADTLLLPGYVGRLFAYDLRRPWRDKEPDANPRLIGEIGGGLAWAAARSAEGLIAIASPPGYGRRGGALTLFDGQSHHWQTFSGLVPDQALSAVCFGPRGYVYIGSSVEVGPGAVVVARTARLIVFDPHRREVVADVVPDPSAAAVQAVVPLDDDRVLGATSAGLFVFNVKRGKARVLPDKTGQVLDLMRWDRENAIVGIAWPRGLFRIDVATLALTWCDESPKRLRRGMAVDAHGRLHVHDGVRVYRVHRL